MTGWPGRRRPRSWVGLRVRPCRDCSCFRACFIKTAARNHRERGSQSGRGRPLLSWSVGSEFWRSGSLSLFTLDGEPAVAHPFSGLAVNRKNLFPAPHMLQRREKTVRRVRSLGLTAQNVFHGGIFPVQIVYRILVGVELRAANVCARISSF